MIKKKISKSDVKRIPKIQNVRPNITISPYDLANMVQQKFRQDMEADTINIQRRQAELEAQSKAIASPEFQKALDANTRSLMSLQKEIDMFKHEQQRQEIESQRAFQNTPQFREMMTNLTKIRQDIKHTSDMTAAESDKIQANIVRELQSSQEAYNQRLEKAIAQRETEYMNKMNDIYERQAQLQADAIAREETQNDLIKKTIEEQKTEYMKQINDLKTQQAQIEANTIAREENRDKLIEKARIEREAKLYKQINDRLDGLSEQQAKLEAHNTDIKSELHQMETKRYKKKEQKAANESAKAKVEQKHLETMKEIAEQQQENVKQEAYNDAMLKQGLEYATEEGVKQAESDMAKLKNERLNTNFKEEVNAHMLAAKTKYMQDNLSTMADEIASRELELGKISQEAKYNEEKQQFLLKRDAEIKKCQTLLDEMKGHIRSLKSADPTSRLTGDDSLFERDLDMLGPELERYQFLQRRVAELRALDHLVLNPEADKDLIEYVRKYTLD